MKLPSWLPFIAIALLVGRQ